MATITVDTLVDENDDGLNEGTGNSLREAIEFANAGDTIVFDPSIAGGTITLTNGELEVDKDITIDADETNPITIDAASSSRVFNIDDGNNLDQSEVTIDGLILTGGYAFGSSNLGDGGAIFTNEMLTLTNSAVTGNTASGDGGGIYINDYGSANISNTTIDGNEANYDGGGIFAFGTLNLSNSTISNNRSIAISGDGGGVAVFGTTNITQSTISGNTAGSDGGGVYVKDYDPSSFHYTSATISNSTITNNYARDGYGSGLATFGYEITTTVTSTIISGNVNSDVDELTANSHAIASGGNNLIGTGSATVRFNATGDQTGVVNPGLSPLADNGGQTQTHALLSGSAAIDAGSNSLGLTTDQRGTGFDRVVGDGIDIGAFEAGNPIPSPTPTPTCILGTSGNDSLEGDNQDNCINGFGGQDELLGRQGNDTLFGGGNNDTLLGNQDHDTLLGEDGLDSLIGGQGQDTLIGGNNTDVLKGGDDNDLLDGSQGRDTLIGEQGADGFLLRSAEGNDLITDFDDGIDSLLLDGLVYNDLTIEDSGSDTIIKVTGTSEIIATLQGIEPSAIDSSDFVVI